MARSLGYGHSRARLIHKRRESSLVMTEESGGPNLAAFVPFEVIDDAELREIYAERIGPL